jgi:hypothetical protein
LIADRLWHQSTAPRASGTRADRYTVYMKRVLTFIAMASLMTASVNCPAQDRSSDDPSQISREEWQAQIKAARERLIAMRREHKSFAPRTPTPEERAEEASRRILEDESLMPGDLVSTNRGLFRFEGPPERERRPEDFVRIR